MQVPSHTCTHNAVTRLRRPRCPNNNPRNFSWGKNASNDTCWGRGPPHRGTTNSARSMGVNASLVNVVEQWESKISRSMAKKRISTWGFQYTANRSSSPFSSRGVHLIQLLLYSPASRAWHEHTIPSVLPCLRFNNMWLFNIARARYQRCLVLNHTLTSQSKAQEGCFSIIPEHHLTEMEENTILLPEVLNTLMFTFPSQNQTQGHYRRSYPWCANKNKGVWKEDWKKEKRLPHRFTACRPFTSNTADKHSLGRQRERAIRPFTPESPTSSDLPESPLTHAFIHWHSFVVSCSLLLSYNCRCAISPLVSSKAVKRHCSDGGGGCVYVCVRMYVCLCSSVFVSEWVREYESNGGRSQRG